MLGLEGWSFGANGHMPYKCWRHMGPGDHSSGVQVFLLKSFHSADEL